MSARKKVSFGSRGSMVETWIIDDNSVACKPYGDVREIRNSDCWDDRMTSSTEVVVVTQPTNHGFSNHHVVLNDPICIVRSQSGTSPPPEEDGEGTEEGALPLNSDSQSAPVYPMTSQAPVMIPRYGGGGGGGGGSTISSMNQRTATAAAAAVLMPSATVYSSNRSSICSNVSSNSGGPPYRRYSDVHHVNTTTAATAAAAAGGEGGGPVIWPTTQEEYYNVLHPKNRHQTPPGLRKLFARLHVPFPLTSSNPQSC